MHAIHEWPLRESQPGARDSGRTIESNARRRSRRLSPGEPRCGAGVLHELPRLTHDVFDVAGLPNSVEQAAGSSGSVYMHAVTR